MDQTDGKSANDERAGRILDAAARLIIHYGYDKTTVSDIAREAGISKGAIYLHWESKEALFEALLERETWRYGDDWLRRFDQERGEWSFMVMFRLMLLTLQDHPFMLALFRRDPRVLGSFLRQDSKLLQQKFAINSEVFGMLQESGAVRGDIAPRVIAHLFNLFAYGLVSIEEVMPAQDIPPLEETIDGLAKLLDRGFAPEGGGNRDGGKALILRLVEALRAQFRQAL